MFYLAFATESLLFNGLIVSHVDMDCNLAPKGQLAFSRMHCSFNGLGHSKPQFACRRISDRLHFSMLGDVAGLGASRGFVSVWNISRGERCTIHFLFATDHGCMGHRRDPRHQSPGIIYRSGRHAHFGARAFRQRSDAMVKRYTKDMGMVGHPVGRRACVCRVVSLDHESVESALWHIVHAARFRLGRLCSGPHWSSPKTFFSSSSLVLLRWAVVVAETSQPLSGRLTPRFSDGGKCRVRSLHRRQ